LGRLEEDILAKQRVECDSNVSDSQETLLEQQGSVSPQDQADASSAPDLGAVGIRSGAATASLRSLEEAILESLPRTEGAGIHVVFSKENDTVSDKGEVDLEGDANSGVPLEGGDLAVALPVTERSEDDDDFFMPSAVKYDPDAKLRAERIFRFRLYGILAFVVISAIVIGLSVGLTRNGGGTNEVPATEALPYRETIGIRENVERFIGGDKLDEAASPYARALHWITHTDPLQLTPRNATFVQRYLAAYLYFATSVDRNWTSCNPPEEGEDESCDYIMTLDVDPLSGDTEETVASKRWLSGASECLWAGVWCDQQGQIDQLELSKYLPSSRWVQVTFCL
jgi:hypothetical protein